MSSPHDGNLSSNLSTGWIQFRRLSHFVFSVSEHERMSEWHISSYWFGLSPRSHSPVLINRPQGAKNAVSRSFWLFGQFIFSLRTGQLCITKDSRIMRGAYG